jgi:hypothetical protein
VPEVPAAVSQDPSRPFRLVVRTRAVMPTPACRRLCQLSAELLGRIGYAYLASLGRVSSILAWRVSLLGGVRLDERHRTLGSCGSHRWPPRSRRTSACVRRADELGARDWGVHAETLQPQVRDFPRTEPWRPQVRDPLRVAKSRFAPVSPRADGQRPRWGPHCKAPGSGGHDARTPNNGDCAGPDGPAS